MAKKIPEPTFAPRERAFLVGAEIYQEKNLLSLEDSLTELALLADTAGLDVVGEMTQKMDRAHNQTYIGSGKVEELKTLCEETLATIVVFDNELNPRHQRELEELLAPNVRVMDGRFMAIEQAMGTPKGREAGLLYLREFVEEMKASGFVARGLEKSGQGDAAVAPRATGQ